MPALNRPPHSSCLFGASGVSSRLSLLLGALLAILLPSVAGAQEINVQGGSGLNVTISDGDTSPRTTDGTDFGTANVTGGSVEKTFRIRNTAANDFNPLTGNLVITSITENSSHFSVVSAPIVALAEGQFGDLTIRFDPTSDGVKTATVEILNNDSNEGTYTFSIRGEGLGFPEISVYGLPNVFGDGTAISDGDTSPRTADGTDFGTVDALGPDVSHTFRVRNTGTAPLTCSVTDNSGHFAVSGLSSSVGVNGLDDFNVTYNPQSSGTHTATITISNNDSNENPYTFTVRGTARAPEISVAGGTGLNVNIPDGDTTPNTTDRTDFGSIDVDDGAIDRVFRIRNTETDDGNPLTGNLVITSITENSSQFSIASGPIVPIPEGGFADFTVRFDPTAIGAHTATVTILNNDIDDGEGTFTFRVTGDGTGSPEILVDGRPNVFGTFFPINDGDTTPEVSNGTFFGSLSVNGGSITHQVRVQNIGSAPLTVSASETSSSFSVSPLSGTVNPGTSSIFNVTFNPATSGALSADITLDTNDPDGGEDPYTFRVSGTGTAPEIELRGGASFVSVIFDNDNSPATGDGTDFGSRDVLAAPLNRTFQIRNLGNESLVISSVTVSDTTNFAVLPGVILPIAPGGNATFTIGFAPASIGTHTAQVTVQHNDPSGGESPYNFAIVGVGTGSPEIEVFGKPAGPLDGFAISDGDTTPDLADGTDFGSLDVNLGPVTHTFRIRNTGSADLTVAIGESSAAFSLASVPASIPPGGADDFNVIFDPATTGEHTADLVITHNDPDGGENPYTFRVRGNGNGPEIVVSGGQFLSVPIPDGDTTPRPDDHTDFGTVEIGEDSPVAHRFQIGNSAIDDFIPAGQLLIIDSITLSGAGAGQFSITSLPIVLPMQEGGAAELRVLFAPTAQGTHEATVTIRNNDPDEDPYTFLIRGVATSSPEIGVFGVGILSELEIPNRDSTPSLAENTDFGRPNLPGPPTTKPFRIRNTGSADLTVSATVDGSPDFSITGLARSIPAGGGDDFDITFDPSSTGERTATITIANNDPDGNEDPYTFLVRGEGRAPEIAVFGGAAFALEILHDDETPRVEDGTLFAETEVGSSVDHTFRIDNLQDPDGSPLTGNLIIIDIIAQTVNPGLPFDAFEVVSSHVLTIEEGGFATFTVRFAPTEVGPVSTTIGILHNDPDGDEFPFSFRVTGTGTGEPDIQVFGSPTPITDGFEIQNGDMTPSEHDGTDFGRATLPIPNVAADGRSFRIRNNGNVPLGYEVRLRHVGEPTEELHDIFVLPPAPGELFINPVPPGGFSEFLVRFNAQTSGFKQVLVEISSDDPDEDPYTFMIQGVATAPEIEVFGGDDFSISILHDDLDPQEADGTHFGEVAIGSGGAERTFRIRNLEPDDNDPTTLNSLLVLDLVLLNDSNGGEDFVPGSLFPDFPVVIPIGAGQFFDFTVRFDPTTSGSHIGSVIIAHNDPDDDEQGFYHFGLAGTAIAAPEIEVFGLPIPLINDGIPIANGDASPQLADGTDFGHFDLIGVLPLVRHTFRVRNSGALPLTVAVTDDDAAFGTEGLEASIAAGGFDDFDIIFDPPASGTYRATVTITNNDSDENPYTFEVTGIASAPEIAVHGGPAFDLEIVDGDSTPRPDDGTDFGEASVSGGAIEHSFRLRNVQPADASPFTNNLNIVSITTDDPQFAIVSPLILPIPEEGQADFTVRFQPSAPGPQSATVTIVHNDPDGGEAPFDFVLTGVGTGEPEIEVYGLPIPFLNDGIPIANGDDTPDPADGTGFPRVLAGSSIGGPANTLRIRNSGEVALSVAVSVDSDQFEITIPASSSIPAGGFSDFTIQFNPNSDGVHTALVTIDNDDPDGGEDPYTFVITGEAFAPEIVVRGGPSFEFPIQSGDLDPRPADSTDFGTTPLSGAVERAFRIFNVAPENGSPLSGQLHLQVITVSGSENFSISNGAPLVPIPILVPEQAFHDFTVRFDPTAEGDFSANVAIIHNDPDGDEQPYVFAVVARAGDPDIEVWGGPGFPEIANGDLTPDAQDGTDFGAVEVDERPADHRFRIVNRGVSELTVQVTSDSPDFVVQFSGEVPVAPDGVFGFEVHFDPSTPGVKEATITITSNDPDENPYTFRVRGEGTAPEIEVRGGPTFEVVVANGDVTPDLADRTEFGTAQVGGPPVINTFRLVNAGTAELNVDVTDDSDHFGTAGVPASVAPGSSADFTIHFAPTSAGTKTATIRISSNDEDESPYTFLVRGNGRGEADNKIATRFSLRPGPGGGGTMDFQSVAGKTYRITTSTDLATFHVIPELTGITGTGDLLGIDLSAYLPSATNRTRFFRVEEE